MAVSLALLAFLQALTGPALAIDLDIDDTASIKNAASTIVYDMMSMYQGNQSGNVPGLLPDSGRITGYAWYEGGMVMSSLVQYWHLTGDPSYNPTAQQAMLFQRGEGNDYYPANYTASLANDDQMFWTFPAMEALEYGFPDPAPGQPQWLQLTQNVFNRQIRRWDTAACGGGLRWPILRASTSYDYKNAISQGGLFNLAARLARFTGNSTYLEWAEKTWDWTENIGLIDSEYNVWDGTHTTENCTDLDKLQWSVNVALFMHGASVMWNITSNPEWRARVDGLVSALDLFLPDRRDILVERACEDVETCNPDQLTFKGLTASFIARTAVMAPYSANRIKSVLATNAKAAAKSCRGGDSGTMCGFNWQNYTNDGTTGFGQQMDGLQVIQWQLLDSATSPRTSNSTPAVGASSNETGETSTTPSNPSNSSANTADSDQPKEGIASPISTGSLGTTFGIALLVAAVVSVSQ